MELDKGLQERSERFAKEKQQLVEQNKQLRQQLDKAEADNATIRSRRQEQENELKDLRENKLLLDQWEKQIHDIITWISEEKDARYVCTIPVREVTVEWLSGVTPLLKWLYIVVFNVGFETTKLISFDV